MKMFWFIFSNSEFSNWGMEQIRNLGVARSQSLWCKHFDFLLLRVFGSEYRASTKTRSWKISENFEFSTSPRTTLYNVCSVHRGMFSTSGGVQYIGGIPWVHRGDTMSTSGGYHEYIGGISWVHRGVFSTSEGYHEYIGGCSVHRRDTMSTSGGYHEYIGGIGGISWYMWGDEYGGIQYIGGCSVPPEFIMISLRCTEHPPMYSWMYSWYPSDVLNIPRCTHGIPHVHHDIPPMYWTSPDVLMISPWCTHGIPPMYWTPPDVLNIPRCTEHTLYRVRTPLTFCLWLYPSCQWLLCLSLFLRLISFSVKQLTLSLLL